MRQNLDSLVSLVEQGEEIGLDEFEKLQKIQKDEIETAVLGPAEDGGRVIEGVFNGELMVGSDGNEYVVPPNYASKSKLIEGDILKLTITPDGSFIYKQIGPIERQRVVGELIYDKEEDEYSVVSDKKSWRVLPASVTFFKGDPGDEAVILIPKDEPSRWAAVENIIKK
jgi:hypothetical protein